MPKSLDYSLVAASQSSLFDFRRKAALFPATHELRETFGLRRILLKRSQKTDEELHAVHKFLSEHTTMWREPFWALLSEKERLDVVDCVKLRMVPRGGESEDFIAADSTSGSMVIVAFRGLIQVRCFDSQETSLEFQSRETFGFLPVPKVLMEDAERNVEKVKANPRSNVFRGLREYIERRQTVAEAGKIRVKVSCDCEYIFIRGADVVPMLQRIAKKHIRSRLLTSIGLELPGASGGSGAEGLEKKREMLLREARYSMGSILVEEGAPPTTVFVIIEGECRIVKGKPQSQAAAKTIGKSLRHNLSSSRRGKVGILFTNGFHTQVDACQLGTLGPKALVGDIPALLGGLQPASVVAKTPLRVLQCRADKFSNNLDHNIRARMVYMEAAKARKAWMEERGAEVERLMSLAGMPLLLNVGGNTDITSKGTAKEDLQDVDQRRRRGSSWKSADASPVATSSTRPTDRLRKSRGRELHQIERGTLRLNQPDEANGKNEPDMTSKALGSEIRPSAIFAVKPREPPREPNRERMVATTSSPMLPGCLLGSRVDFRRGQRTHGKTKAGNDCLFGLQSDGVKMSEPASVGELARAVRPKGTVVQEPDDSNRAGRSEGRGSWLTSSKGRGRNEGREDSLAESLLASHLEPFPTITRNRCLHAVPQPILPRSAGFVDAFRGDISMLGTAAWRLSRAAKFDDLVSPADRESIVRQIESGLNALQGRRVSPLA